MNKLAITSVQCSAIKKDGTRCPMKTKSDSGRCHLHSPRTLAQQNASRNNGAKLSKIFNTIDGLNQRCVSCSLREFLITEDGDKRICPYFIEDGVCLIERENYSPDSIDYTKIENIDGLMNALLSDQLNRYGFERVREIVEGGGAKTTTDTQLSNMIKLLERLEKLKNVKIKKEIVVEASGGAWDKLFGD